MASDDDDINVWDVIQFTSKVWNEAKKRGLLDRIREFFNRPEPIIVLGATGSGKTNFLTSLSASANYVDPIPRTERTDQVEKASIKILNRPFLLIDTPGQDAHKHLRDDVIRETIAAGQVRVINVVSYGYHEYKAASVSDAVDEHGAPRAEYLADRRLVELGALQEWLTLLGDRKVTPWILTVITKADLWWVSEPEVSNHYERGVYAESIKSADPKLHHVVRPYCSVMHRFYGTGLLSGTFDDTNRMDLNYRLMEQLAKLGKV